MLSLLVLACLEGTSTDAHPEATAPLADCVMPELDALPASVHTVDLLREEVRAQSLTTFEDLAHMVAADTRGALSFMAGTPGLLVVDASSGTPEVIGEYRGENVRDLDFVHAFGDGTVVVSDSAGALLIDVRNPTAPRMMRWAHVPALSDVVETVHGTLALTRDGQLLDWDTGEVFASGLGSTRDLEVVDNVAMVVEREWGLTLVDLDTGAVTRMRTAAPPTAATRTGDVLYVALGSAGVQLFDISDPSFPTRIWTHELPGTATDLVVVDDTLWVATIDGVATMDVTIPRVPRLISHQPTPEFALALAPSWGGVVVADWSYLHQMQRGDEAPVLELSHRAMAVAESGTLVLSNPSSTPLSLLNISGSEGLELSEMPEVLPGGESVELTVTLGTASEGELCIATNDTAEPLRRVAIHQGQGIELAVGQQAPDFVLPGLDGTSYSLEAHRGRPVILVFFATWCPICAPELDDVQSMADTWGAEVWLVAPADDPAVLRDFVEDRNITLPVLVDEGGVVYAQWQQTQQFQTLFPQNWVVGQDGTIVYGSNHYEPDALADAIR